MSHIPMEPDPDARLTRPGILRALRDRRLCDLAKSIAAAALDVSESDIAMPSRSSVPVCEARHVAMYLASVSFEVRLASIAREFGRDRTSVGHAIRRIEDRRDDRGFERRLEQLERLAETCLRVGVLGRIGR